MEGMLQSAAWQLLLGIVTLLAMFGDDFRLLVLPYSVDSTYSVLAACVLFLMLLEIVANSVYLPGYFSWHSFSCRRWQFVGSAYFWLDLLAAVSMLTEVRRWATGVRAAALTHPRGRALAQLHWLQVQAPTLVERESGSLSAYQHSRDLFAAMRGARAARAVRLARITRVSRVLKLVKWRCGGGAASLDEVGVR